MRCMKLFADLVCTNELGRGSFWNRYDEALVYVDKIFHPRPTHVKVHNPLLVQNWKQKQMERNRIGVDVFVRSSCTQGNENQP